MRRSRSRNPYGEGITRIVDRHGKVRYRFRFKGRPDCYIEGEFGSLEWTTNYEKARNGELPDKPSRFPPGTFDWLIEKYQRGPTWADLAPITRANLANEMDRFRAHHGHRFVRDLRPAHVESVMAKMVDRPGAANKWRKLVRRLCKYAIRLRLITVDPTAGTPKLKVGGDGFHTWTETEVKKFEQHHGVDSVAVLAMRLVLWTAAARQDVCRLGWQSVSGGRISYRRHKTEELVDLPIQPELQEVLDRVPRNQFMFITWGEGRPYKPTTFGNAFGDWCREAGVPGQAHGLRKFGASRLATAGCTELEIAAYLGHGSTGEARVYVKKASRAKLADNAFRKLKGEQVTSNLVERLDIDAAKSLKDNAK